MFVEIAIEFLQLLMVMFGSPLLVGVIRKSKARLQGRRGASIFQPYADIRKLLLKEVVVSENTSWIFRFTPYLLATTMLLSALIVPVLTTRAAARLHGQHHRPDVSLLARHIFSCAGGPRCGQRVWRHGIEPRGRPCRAWPSPRC